MQTTDYINSCGHACRGDFIASGGAGGELRVWDLASREMVVHLKHHSLAITDLKVGGGACKACTQCQCAWLAAMHGSAGVAEYGLQALYCKSVRMNGKPGGRHPLYSCALVTLWWLADAG